MATRARVSSLEPLSILDTVKIDRQAERRVSKCLADVGLHTVRVLSVVTILAIKSQENTATHNI